MTYIDLWLALPLVILCAGILLLLLLGPLFPGRYGTTIAMVTLFLALLWMLQPPPVILAPTLHLAATPLGRLFSIIFLLLAMAPLLLGYEHNRRHRIMGEEYPATILFATFGALVLASATNLLLLFLGLEALTFAFYILTALDRHNPLSAEAGLKYLLPGAVAAAFLSFGMALLYAGSGTLTLSPTLSPTGPFAPILLAGWGMVILGISFKLSLAPLHLWTPDVYEGGPAPAVAFLATASKGGAFLALLMLLMATKAAPAVRPVLWGLSLFSMVAGTLGAVAQVNIRRLLAYSAVVQMGYLLIPLLTGSRSGYIASTFYLFLYLAMVLAPFAIITTLATERPLMTLSDLRGLGFRRPLLAGVLALSLLALAGIPPTAGFMGKLILFRTALAQGEMTLAMVGIIASIVSAWYYMRVVVSLYLQEPEGATTPPTATFAEGIVFGTAALLILGLGFYPAPLLQLLQEIFPS
jgi:NADH-quinone oxidoreductase subunit N